MTSRLNCKEVHRGCISGKFSFSQLFPVFLPCELHSLAGIECGQGDLEQRTFSVHVLVQENRH